MNPLDLVIVTIFLIIVAYVLIQAIDSVDKQVKIEFDSKGVDQQLEEKQLNGIKLKDIVKISFKFESRYKYSTDKVEEDKLPRALILMVENLSNKLDREIYVYVHWDKSTLTDHENESRRVIHLDGKNQLTDRVPPKTQTVSPVSPGMKFTGNLTAEELLKLDEAKVILEPTAPVLNLSAIKAKSKNKKVPKNVREALEKKLTSFEERTKSLEFSLLLMLQFVDLTPSAETEVIETEAFRLIKCKFTVTSMPWHDQLPWNPKK
jgi:hypothetical protein